MVGTGIAASDDRAPIYSRIILKLSGEALLGHQSNFGIHHGTVRRIAEEIGKGAARWSLLKTFLVSPGFTDETVHIYLAQELTEVPGPESHEEADSIELGPCPLGRLDAVAGC